MKWITDLSIFLHMATIGICLLLSAVIAGKKAYYQQANRYLILLMVVTSIVHINAALILSGYEKANLHFQNIQNAFGLLFGPALFFTTRLRLSTYEKVKKIPLHFLPFFVFLSIVLLFYSEVLPKSGWSIAEPIALVFFMLQLPTYIVLTYWFIRKEEHTFFRTLRILLLGLLFLYLFQVVIIGYRVLVQDIPNIITLNSSLLFSLCVITFAYKSLADDNILFDSPKYLASSLTKKQAEVMVKKIIDIMEEEQLFLQPQLKISEVAARLDSTSKYISQAINDSLGKNFHEFINEYRVKHVKELLENIQNNHFTLLALAQQAGFKSGSVFNAAFKKHTGMLPSEYRKKMIGTDKK